MSARRALLVAPVVLGLVVLACPHIPSPGLHEVATFEVQVLGVFYREGATRKPQPVVTRCAAQYGGQDQVPADVKGTSACRYAIPRGEVELDLSARAMTLKGEQVADFNQPVSFRVLPGDLTGGYGNRWTFADHGLVKGTVLSRHQYGDVRVWVEHAPPLPIYDGGLQVGRPEDLPPPDAVYTYASGLSPVVKFDDQTLQSLQLPDGFDNRSSPFVGEFVAVGKNPESGEKLLQSCPDDARRDGQQSVMVVTGIDPTGFFVTDITACRLVEWTKDSAGATQVRNPEPPEPCYLMAADGGFATAADGGRVTIEQTDAGAGKCDVSQRTCRRRADCPGYLPGNFASMFVYNYNYPDGLNEGDLLFSVSGAVQEFTSTTQMVFPAWSIAESVRTLPPDQWGKWLKFVPPYVLTERTCGMDNAWEPFLTDQLCGHNRRNLKMESLESTLVTLRRVRFPQTFKNCDFNSDQSVPFFCEQTDSRGMWIWGSCAFGEVEQENDRLERECTQECVLGGGVYDGIRCSEQATFVGFGQFVVEMNSPGPADAGFDDSLPARTQLLAVPGSTDGGVPGVGRLEGFSRGNDASLVCNVPVRVRFSADRPPDATDPLLPAGEPLHHHFGVADTLVAVLGDGRAGSCSVGWDIRARINLLTKDAIPELQVDCSEADANAEKAKACRELHAATFDVTGHLRHVQPARPRWMVIPRNADDVCCHPGAGMGCPKPVKACK